MKISLLLLLTLLGAIDGETGVLRIHSQPEVEVLWEGVSLGNTDAGGSLTVSDIPPGTFALSLRRPGFRDYRKTITIAANTTISLEATLEPAPGARSPSTQAPKPSLPESRKPPEPAKADQGNRLNQLLKSPPKEGPLPVWPAASRAAPEERGLNVPIWPFVLGGTVLIVAWWLSRKLKPTAFSRSPALLADSDVLQPSPPAPPRTAAFLSDLKKREELLEQGVEIVPERVKGPVIDLDSGSVREVEEQ